MALSAVCQYGLESCSAVKFLWAGEGFCNLCLTEKFRILKSPDSIGRRSGLTSKCRHLNGFLVRDCI